MKPHKQKKFATLRAWNRKRNYFMKALRMRMAKWIWDEPVRRPFDLRAISKVLLLRNDGKIGDMIVSTSLIRELRTNGYTVDILATRSNVVVIEHNPHIRKIHFDDNPNITTELAAEDYDLVIDMGDKISPASFHFLKKIKAKNVLGFNKEQYNLYNKTIAFLGYQEHITHRYALLMDELNFSHSSTAYELFYPDAINTETTAFLQTLPNAKNIIVNPFAADAKREMSVTQVRQLFSELRQKHPDYNIVYFDPNKRFDIELPDGVYKNPHLTLYSAMALIAHADLIISPDTAIVHIAATYNKPLVALYGNEMHGKYHNNDIWGPGYDAAVQIMTKDKYHPISTIKVSDIIDAVGHMLHKHTTNSHA